MDQTNGEIDRKYSPEKWGWVSENVEKAYKSDSPTIAGYKEKFGLKPAAAWVSVQLLALYGTSRDRTASAADGIIQFAESFVSKAGGFRLTELMLFFSRYKAGYYDNSYATFDARRIGNAFFKEFLPERNLELAKFYRKEEQDRIEKSRYIIPPGYTSLSLYQRLKDFADNGDPMAAALITDRAATAEIIIQFLESKYNDIQRIPSEDRKIAEG